MLALMGIPPVVSLLLGIVAVAAGAATHHTILLLVGAFMVVMSGIRALSRKNGGRR